MTLIIILLVVFTAVALMVILGERFGKPMEPEQQQKYSKIAMVCVFILLLSALLKNIF